MTERPGRVWPGGAAVLMLAAALGGGGVMPVAHAQRDLSGTAEIHDALGRASTVASVLMIAAHPDDENTALLAWYARGRHMRTAYLSLTRGEGGQNLVGPEQGDLMGVIRTQELLAARRIDGAEQFFTRAIDFGFSKTPDETLAKWGREKILSDIVWTIRTFRPDVIILRFTGTGRDGHGQHQASAILGKEAFFAAADPAKFPEQLKLVSTWQAKRLMHNLFSFTREQEQEAAKLGGRIEIDTGAYDAVLGHSYAEIAGMSRSLHRSQGMGAPERRGSARQYLITIAGEPARTETFDGIDTTWNRVGEGGGEVDRLMNEARRSLDPEHPDRIVPLLERAWRAASELKGEDAGGGARRIAEAVALCSGLWLDAEAERYAAVPGSKVGVRTTTLARSPLVARLNAVTLEGLGDGGWKADAGAGKILDFNQPEVHAFETTVPAAEPYSQPYWLAAPHSGDTYSIDAQAMVNQPDSPPVARVRFDVNIQGQAFQFTRPLIFRYIERDRGELTRPFTVAPPVAIGFPQRALVFGSDRPRTVEVQVDANIAGQAGTARLQLPDGWKAEPATRDFDLTQAGEQKVLAFQVTPPAGDTRATLRAVASIGGHGYTSGMIRIAYPHIPPQAVFPPAAAELVRTDVRLTVQRVGYVMGAGDDVPAALRQMGLDVTLLAPVDLAREDLSRFDAIVTGVRAYNVRPDLRANQKRLLAYVEAGGTLVVQYNVLEGGFGGGDPHLLDHIGPYPMAVGRERVTEEDAPVTFPDPKSPLLEAPNKITAADFEGWIQERGLYFAATWDPHYQPVLASHDRGEQPMAGGTLYTRYGKGVFIFSAWSWFRQLPAGVPGAWRMFANLLSAGHAAP